MSYSCKILLDSVSETGKRITTMEITFPRCVLAEAETHRVLRGWDGNVEELVLHNVGINVDENFSRNSASSRAIPINKMIQRVRENPFIPEKWGKPVSGMGAKEYWPLDSVEHTNLNLMWIIAACNAVRSVEAAKDFGNKEDLNRLLEPFMWHTAIITATEWDNFFKLRTNSAADWKIRKIADLMYEAYHAFDEVTAHINKGGNTYKETVAGENWSAILPQKLKIGEWHCPLVYEEDFKLVYECCKTNHDMFNIGNIEQHRIDAVNKYLKKISVARCARVSYLTHDGKRDIEKDLELFERLRTSGHWSPFEHVATPYFVDDAMRETYWNAAWSLPETMNEKGDIRSGNFIGWKSYRKEFPDENCTYFHKDK